MSNYFDKKYVKEQLTIETIIRALTQHVKNKNWCFTAGAFVLRDTQDQTIFEALKTSSKRTNNKPYIRTNTHTWKYKVEGKIFVGKALGFNLNKLNFYEPFIITCEKRSNTHPNKIKTVGTVLFFPIVAGDKKYVYVKFEKYGLRTYRDTIEHLLTWGKSKTDNRKTQLSFTRKEKFLPKAMNTKCKGIKRVRNCNNTQHKANIAQAFPNYNNNKFSDNNKANHVNFSEHVRAGSEVYMTLSQTSKAITNLPKNQQPMNNRMRRPVHESNLTNSNRDKIKRIYNASQNLRSSNS